MTTEHSTLASGAVAAAEGDSRALQRFVGSVRLAQQNGGGFDLEALEEIRGTEQTTVVHLLAQRLEDGGGSWREMEALSVLNARLAPGAGTVLQRALAHPKYEVRLYAWTMIPNESGPLLRRPTERSMRWS